MKLNILKKKILIILSSILLAVSLIIFCAMIFKEKLLSKKPLLHYLKIEDEEYERYCLDKSEFVIGNIPYGITETEVLSIKGTPLRKTVGEDCNVLWYEDLKIIVLGGSMFGLEAISACVTTPSGISLGMSKIAVFNIFGITADKMDKVDRIEKFVHDDGSIEYQFFQCPNELGKVDNFPPAFHVMALKFNSKGILQALDIGQDIP